MAGVHVGSVGVPTPISTTVGENGVCGGSVGVPTPISTIVGEAIFRVGFVGVPTPISMTVGDAGVRGGASGAGAGGSSKSSAAKRPAGSRAGVARWSSSSSRTSLHSVGAFARPRPWTSTCAADFSAARRPSRRRRAESNDSSAPAGSESEDSGDSTRGVFTDSTSQSTVGLAVRIGDMITRRWPLGGDAGARYASWCIDVRCDATRGVRSSTGACSCIFRYGV
mmetsp:Transcript_24506/g.83793  ORF Transcript_24506/g.83793 Transcript_24506/m.83793 type:complete len:224 (+) Transcript_24506:202-873(+)